jgi:hypothetical protein
VKARFEIMIDHARGHVANWNPTSPIERGDRLHRFGIPASLKPMFKLLLDLGELTYNEDISAFLEDLFTASWQDRPPPEAGSLRCLICRQGDAIVAVAAASGRGKPALKGKKLWYGSAGLADDVASDFFEALYAFKPLRPHLLPFAAFLVLEGYKAREKYGLQPKKA